MSDPIPTTIVREVAKVVAGILAEELGLDARHCLLGDQKWTIPADKKLFCVVYDRDPRPIGTTAFMDTTVGSSTFDQEIQQAAMLHDVVVEMMSLDSGEARLRKEEVVMALGSIYAQQQAETNKLQIGRAQVPVYASETETTARLQKYVTHVNITSLHQKVKPLPQYGYFDKFNSAPSDGAANPPEVNTQP